MFPVWYVGSIESPFTYETISSFEKMNQATSATSASRSPNCHVSFGRKKCMMAECSQLSSSVFQFLLIACLMDMNALAESCEAHDRKHE